MSFWHRVSTDATHAVQDVYSHWMLGDDAGKSVHVTVWCPLHTTNTNTNSSSAAFNLGVTVLEIAGRAYVQSVRPNSLADRAGVLPRDAIQLAAVVPESQVSQVVQLEATGARIGYDQWHRVWTEHGATAEWFLSKPRSYTNGNTSNHKSGRNSNKETDALWHGPPLPSTLCAPDTTTDDCNDENPALSRHRSTNASGASSIANSSTEQQSQHASSQQQPQSQSQPSSGMAIVFRRTRQRQSTDTSLWAVRLDDECDLACALVRRLAPTADMEAPSPDTWEELVHDGTDFLLGPGSMLPPKGRKGTSGTGGGGTGGSDGIMPMVMMQASTRDVATETIPLDAFETERAQKLATLRSRMTERDRSDDVEAATLRGMIRTAVGLAFVRASKVVLGVSIHGGSGIVVSRLSDGTWSAPSAIGTWGLGLGLQFGLEVAEYIFILQTQEAMDHFRRGGSYTVGGNMGVAIGGLGREAYGAASVGECGVDTTISSWKLHDDEYNGEMDGSRDEKVPIKSLGMGIAPIVAYAKSQGLYVGVSLEGSRIFTRNDINSRTYKFNSGRDVTANDILSGSVPTPPEAEELYAALHSVEFTHEMSCLPRPPEILRKDSANPWNYDRSTLAQSVADSSNSMDSSDSSPRHTHDDAPFSLFAKLTQRQRDECETFEAQFKNFMYGGVSVQRLLPDTDGRTGRTGKERRTLWLMLPEVGSLRLGFVSKLSDGEAAVSNKSSTQRARREDPSRMGTYDGDVGTVGSEELTIDTALQTRDGSTIGPIRTGNVQLSDKHSVALTDVSVLSQDSVVPIKFRGDDKTQHLRVISIQDVAGTSLLFLANNFREAELLVCGLKLLLERETVRLGVRGGLPILSLGGRNIESSMSPSAARGFRDAPSQQQHQRHRPRSHRSSPRKESAYSASITEDESLLSGMSSVLGNNTPINTNSEWNPRRASTRSCNWGKQPGRDYMRGQAASVEDSEDTGMMNEFGMPQYAHGKQIVRAIEEEIRLPLPLPLCRVLLLDSTSPVIKQWEKDRGDKNFEKSRWAFPPATPRELERHSSEHQLIATGSMCGAHQISHFDRPRYGSLVRLSETHTVDADDPETVSFTVTERNPRRGFSLKVRVVLRANRDESCDASVFAELRPVGKDMSNQAAVHKAFLLVQNEIRSRYGAEGSGLLAGFLSVVDNMAAEKNSVPNKNSLSRPFQHSNSTDDRPVNSQKRAERRAAPIQSGLVSFEDMLKTGRESPDTTMSARPLTPTLLRRLPDPITTKNAAESTPVPPRPGNVRPPPEKSIPICVNNEQESMLIEVKPLPKIRLSLMPSPREEDEENSSSATPVPSKPSKKKKKKKGSSSHASKEERPSPRTLEV